jgi:Flp pilus assembly protein TadG
MIIKKNSYQEGAVFIELALILPLLILLSLIVVEASKAISEYKIIVTQVRNAARYLTTKSPGTNYAEATCMVKTGIPAYPCNTQTLISGLNNPSVTITIYDASNFPTTHRSQKTTGISTNSVTINLVTVEVRGYQYQLGIGDFGYGIFSYADTLQFSPISATMRQIN